MSLLALPTLFEYLCYGSTAIVNILFLQCGDRHYTSESESKDVILTYKNGPRTVRVKFTIIILRQCMFAS